MKVVFNVLIILLSVTCVLTNCSHEKILSTSFSTQDAVILSKVAHIAEITIKCDFENELFVKFPNGKVIPVARVTNNKYQINWIDDIQTNSIGNIILRLYDEEGYGNLRKSQRDGDTISNVKSLADINMITKSVYKGPWMRAELLSAVLVGVVAYYALNTKNKLQI